MFIFLDKHSFFSNCQYGFRASHNTEDALIEFLNEFHDGLNNDLKVAGVFIDVKKAFDMILNHLQLLAKLFDSGFRGVSHLWFSSYLNNRQQRVKI